MKFSGYDATSLIGWSKIRRIEGIELQNNVAKIANARFIRIVRLTMAEH